MYFSYVLVQWEIDLRHFSIHVLFWCPLMIQALQKENPLLIGMYMNGVGNILAPSSGEFARAFPM